MPLFTRGHALLIGVGGDLSNTITDAEGLAELLTDADRCAYPPQQVTQLTSEAAHRQAILDGMDALKQHTTVEDTVIVFFSGHGYQVTSDMGELYFLMPYGYDQSQLAKTCIRGDEFAAKLAAIPAQKLLVLLDCCHAGGVGESKEGGRTLTKAPLPPEALALLSQGRGKVLIASSTASELSYAGRPYSAFTLALLEALCGDGASKKDGYVRVADMALHTREKVPLRTNGRQHPILHFESADNFVVAYYAGGDEQPKGLPFPADSIEIEPEPGRFRSGVIINTGGDFVAGPKITGTVGNVSERAQVAIGQGINQTQQVAQRNTPSPTEQTVIRLLLSDMHRQLATLDELEEGQRITAKHQLEQIEQELSKTDSPPDGGALRVAGDWLLNHTPSLAASLSALFLNPFVAHLVQAVGDVAIGWVHERFGSQR